MNCRNMTYRELLDGLTKCDCVYTWSKKLTTIEFNKLKELRILRHLTYDELELWISSKDRDQKLKELVI